MTFSSYFAAPDQGYDYTRLRGQTYGDSGGGTGGGMNPFSESAGDGTALAGWHPSIIYLLALTAVELLVLGWISTKL